MNKLTYILALVALGLGASQGLWAQKLTDAQKAAAEAAKAMTEAPEAEQVVEEPKYWDEFTFGYSSGGNTHSKT